MPGCWLADVDDSRGDIPPGGPVITHDVEGEGPSQILERKGLEEGVGDSCDPDLVVRDGNDLQAGACAACGERHHHERYERAAWKRHLGAFLRRQSSADNESVAFVEF